MSLAIELKRRLELDDKPIAKRLKLAENVLAYPFFPITNKEEIIIRWLCANFENADEEQRLQNIIALKQCVKLLNFKTSSTNGRERLFMVLAKYLSAEEVNLAYNQHVIECCLYILENPTANVYFHQSPQESFSIYQNLFKNLLKRKNDQKCDSVVQNALCKRVLNNLYGFVKGSNKKTVLANLFIEYEIFSLLFKYEDDAEITSNIFNLCQLVIFAPQSSVLYKTYILALIKGDDLFALFQEKGEVLRPIVKVIDVLLKYSKSAAFTVRDLITFIKYFTKSYKFDESLIFAFNVLLYKCLGIHQEYITVNKNIQSLDLKEDYVKTIHLQNVNCLHELNVNLNTKIPFVAVDDTTKDSKVDFLTFFQNVTSNFTNGDVLNELSLSIIKQTFILEPEILDSKLGEFLPSLISQKKSEDVLGEYDDVLVTLLEIMYKMSRGPEFATKILPRLKSKLEEMDPDQQKLLGKRAKLLQKGESVAKAEEKLLTRDDIFTENFYSKFGKLGSELMSWQHIELFKTLTGYLNEFCISSLENGNASPSVVLLVEVLSSLLSSLYNHSRMADQNIPESVFRKFDAFFTTFGNETLSKFATVILNYPDEPRLLRAFLDLCKNYGNLKLLLWHFQPYFTGESDDSKRAANKHNIYDITILHSYISYSTWKSIYKFTVKTNDVSCANVMNMLILQNVIVDIHLKNNNDGLDFKESFIWNNHVKKYVMDNFENLWSTIESNELYANVVFSNLTADDMTIMSNKIVAGIFEEKIDESVCNRNFVHNNKQLLSALTRECIHQLWLNYSSKKALKSYPSLVSKSNSQDFDIETFFGELESVEDYTKALIDCNVFDSEDATSRVDRVFRLLDKIPIHFMKENVQNLVLFSIVIVQLNLNQIGKANKSLKRIENNCTSIVTKMYELSFKLPNIFVVTSPETLLRLVETDYFKLTSIDGKRDMRHLLKQILLGSITKENLVNLERLVKLLCSVGEESESSSKISDGRFQTASLFLTLLSSMKKTNLSTDLKAAMTKHQKDISSHIVSYFNLIKWKRVNKKLSEVDQNSSVVKDDEMYAYLNVIMPYSIILQSEVSNVSDKKELKKFNEALDFFVKISLKEMLNDDISLHHSKGCCMLINVVLKNYKVFKDVISVDEEALTSQIWQSCKRLVQISHTKIGSEWAEVNSLTLDNIKSICELCSVKFFSSFLTKELLQSSKSMIDNSSNSSVSVEDSYVMKTTWSCFLNANLKIIGKTEARTAAVKQVIKNFFAWLKNVANVALTQTNMKTDKYDVENIDVKDQNVPSVKTVTNKNLEIVYICFDIITEFVSTKKMILSNNLIDNIIQMPIIINFDLSKDQSLDIFCKLFDKCVSLLNNLLFHRIELLQDRLPSFLQSYRKMINILSIKSNSDYVTDKNDIDKLVRLSLNMEKMTQLIVKNEKQDVSRIVSYMVADILFSFQKVSICPPVKFHLQNCIYCLMQLLDNHATGFLMRNMPDASRIMFQQIYDNYKKYYKYTGAS